MEWIMAGETEPVRPIWTIHHVKILPRPFKWCCLVLYSFYGTSFPLWGTAQQADVSFLLAQSGLVGVTAFCRRGFSNPLKAYWLGP